MMRRLHVFHSRSLVEKSVKAPVWIVKELYQNTAYIDKDDLLFQRKIDERVPIMVRYHLQIFDM